MLSGAEVLRFDLLLSALDRLGDHAVFDRNAFFHPEALHEAGNAVGSEDPHQVVFKGEIETRRARVALTAGAAAQLIVDTPCLVALSADDVQPANPHDLLVFGIRLLFEMCKDAVPVGARSLVEAVEVIEVDEILGRR